MNNKKFSLFAIILVIAISILACTINVGGPSYPRDTIPVQPEVVTDLPGQFKSTLQAGESLGNVTITLTETQLTSFFALKLAEQENPLLSDPQVLLRDGQVQIFGKARRSNFTATVRLIVSVSVDDNGQPSIEVTSADFGPFAVPEGVKESIAVVIEELISGSFGSAATGFRMETISIDDGLMTITGRLR